MQCLWMGVPVVTLAGRSAFGRNSIGPLVAAGLPDLIAQSTRDYVEIALRLGRNRQRLDSLRSGLRATVARGPLMDAEASREASNALMSRCGSGMLHAQ